MISFNKEEKVFKLSTDSLSYVFKVTSYNLLEQLYFGPTLNDNNYDALTSKNTFGTGTSVNYPDPEKENRNLENERLEYSFIGIGDYRILPIEVVFPDGSYNSRFSYNGYDISSKDHNLLEAPHGRDVSNDDCLTIHLVDTNLNVQLDLVYVVYSSSNCIGRYVKLINNNEKELTIRKLLSLQIDFMSGEYNLLNFTGNWAKETHTTSREITIGTYSQESSTGTSSNRCNPGLILHEKSCSENLGTCIGFNLIYSGNHYSAVSKSPSGGLVRVVSGINPFCFNHIVKKGESFITPECIMSYSDLGFNNLSKNFHHFVNNRLISPNFKDKTRQIVINSWETFGFDFSYNKLLSLAKKSSKLGIELFVLDDGWFSTRNDDTQGLGDYDVNTKKLSGGLPRLINSINKLGLEFGIWIEPEMINTNSKLYKSHPEYSLTVPGIEPLKGRNQLLLNITLPEVQEYIISNISNLLSNNNIKYIKWDMNRPISDLYNNDLNHQGEFYHNYVLSLYKILDRITNKFPDVLFESCASGGNRFDYGMLYYTPQIWSSDNTDPTERINIQKGLSYLYPLSTISNHISSDPHFSTLRKTFLDSRFNVASFGVFGYELNLNHLNKQELKEVKEQISLYKKHRDTFQFGEFSRIDSDNPNLFIFQVKNNDDAVQLRYQTMTPTGVDFEKLVVPNLERDSFYQVSTPVRRLDIKRFGHLLTFALPKGCPKWVVTNKTILNLVSKFIKMYQPIETYNCSGMALLKGIPLMQQFMGTGWNTETRIMADGESQLYIIKKGE